MSLHWIWPLPWPLPSTLSHPWLLTLLLASFLLILLLRLTQTRGPRLANPVPHGPRGHWLTGNTSVRLDELAKRLFSWREQYGPIFEFGLLPGQSLFIVINDVILAKEMLMRKEFAGREGADHAFLRAINPDSLGLVHQSWSPDWLRLHRFVTSSLASMGFGRARMEAKVLAEADALVEAMLEKRGASFEPMSLIRVAVANVVTNLVFGTRTEIGGSSPLQNAFNSHVEGFFYLLSHPIYNTFPLAMRLFPSRKLKETFSALRCYKSFVADLLRDHAASLDPAEHDPRDFLEAVLIERRKFPSAPHLSAANVERTVLDLAIAGTGSVAAAISWIIAWLLRRPDIAATLRREIDAVLGSKAPSVEALERLHYAKAFVDETLRRSSVLDTSLHHRAIEPGVKLGGFDMPEDKVILVNLWGIHHDPDLWVDPMTFDPTRFLDPEGRYKKNENLLAFGIGPRACIGEKLARMELLFFATRLLQRTEIRLGAGCEMPEMEGRKPGFRVPEKYEIVVEAV